MVSCRGTHAHSRSPSNWSRASSRDILKWFDQSPLDTRVEFVCNLLRICTPTELRFFGSCLEELARLHYEDLRELESVSNAITDPKDVDETFSQTVASTGSSAQFNNQGLKFVWEQVLPTPLHGLVADPLLRDNLIVRLSLLHSTNMVSAGAYFDLLMKGDSTAFHHTACCPSSTTYSRKVLSVCTSSDESETTTDQLSTSAIKLTEQDLKTFSELLLLYTLAAFHPAFTFEHRQRLSARLNNLRMWAKRLHATGNNRSENIKPGLYTNEANECSSSFIDSCHPFAKNRSAYSSVPLDCTVNGDCRASEHHRCSRYHLTCRRSRRPRSFSPTKSEYSKLEAFHPPCSDASSNDCACSFSCLRGIDVSTSSKRRGRSTEPSLSSSVPSTSSSSAHATACHRHYPHRFHPHQPASDSVPSPSSSPSSHLSDLSGELVGTYLHADTNCDPAPHSEEPSTKTLTASESAVISRDLILTCTTANGSDGPVSLPSGSDSVPHRHQHTENNARVSFPIGKHSKNSTIAFPRLAPARHSSGSSPISTPPSEESGSETMVSVGPSVSLPSAYWCLKGPLSVNAFHDLSVLLSATSLVPSPTCTTSIVPSRSIHTTAAATDPQAPNHSVSNNNALTTTIKASSSFSTCAPAAPIRSQASKSVCQTTETKPYYPTACYSRCIASSSVRAGHHTKEESDQSTSSQFNGKNHRPAPNLISLAQFPPLTKSGSKDATNNTVAESCPVSSTSTMTSVTAAVPNTSSATPTLEASVLPAESTTFQSNMATQCWPTLQTLAGPQPATPCLPPFPPSNFLMLATPEGVSSAPSTFGFPQWVFNPYFGYALQPTPLLEEPTAVDPRVDNPSSGDTVLPPDAVGQPRQDSSTVPVASAGSESASVNDLTSARCRTLVITSGELPTGVGVQSGSTLSGPPCAVYCESTSVKSDLPGAVIDNATRALQPAVAAAACSSVIEPPAPERPQFNGDSDAVNGPSTQPAVPSICSVSQPLQQMPLRPGLLQPPLRHAPIYAQPRVSYGQSQTVVFSNGSSNTSPFGGARAVLAPRSIFYYNPTNHPMGGSLISTPYQLTAIPSHPPLMPLNYPHPTNMNLMTASKEATCTPMSSDSPSSALTTSSLTSANANLSSSTSFVVAGLPPIPSAGPFLPNFLTTSLPPPPILANPPPPNVFYTSSPSSSNAPIPGLSSTIPRTLSCYFCGLPGHKAKHCPSRRVSMQTSDGMFHLNCAPPK